VDGGRPPSLATEYSANPLAFTRAGVALPDHPQRWAANGPAEADELAATCAETLRGRPLTGPLCQQVSVCALQARPNDELSKLCDQCDTVVGRENLLGCAKVAGIPSTELGRM
jgi:hypothetical protein